MAFNLVQCPTDVVMLVVLWRLRYKLSLRDLVEMFAVRGYEFTHETVRECEVEQPHRARPLRCETALLSGAWLRVVRRRRSFLHGFN